MSLAIRVFGWLVRCCLSTITIYSFTASRVTAEITAIPCLPKAEALPDTFRAGP